MATAAKEVGELVGGELAAGEPEAAGGTTTQTSLARSRRGSRNSISSLVSWRRGSPQSALSAASSTC